MLADELQGVAARRCRVLLLHGLRDVHVLPEAAQRSRDALAAAGLQVELHEFDAGHALGREQIEVVADWLRAHFVAPR
jgi:predicted esterase